MTDAIRTEGDAALLVKLERLKSLQHARAGLLAGGKHIRSLMAEEPAERHVPQPFKTDKQRRGFFAKLRKGEIEVPYRRGRSPGAKGLSKSWHLDVEDDGNRVVVSTNVPYARVVQDEDQAEGAPRGTACNPKICEGRSRQRPGELVGPIGPTAALVQLTGRAILTITS